MKKLLWSLDEKMWSLLKLVKNFFVMVFLLKIFLITIVEKRLVLAMNIRFSMCTKIIWILK